MKVGSAEFLLGTTENPVDVVNVYSEILVGVLGNEISNSQIGGHIGWENNPTENSNVQRVGNKLEDGFYVSLSNELFITHTEIEGGPYYLERTGVMHSGMVPLFDHTKQMEVVDTPTQLISATSQNETAMLVYRLDTSDLRNLKLTPVPASQLKILPAR